MIYTNNEELITELKKLMLGEKISQKELAARLNLFPQALTNLFNKKNLSFADIQKILAVMNADLHFEFKNKSELN